MDRAKAGLTVFFEEPSGGEDLGIITKEFSDFLKKQQEGSLPMTTFICFVIAMVIIYAMRLLTGGFDKTELISFLLMVVLLGSHVYLSTRKKEIFGIVIPIFLVVSFYPVYKVIKPEGTALVVLIGLYVIALGSCLYIWYKARKNDN